LTTTIVESFSWLSPEFTVKSTDKNTVKIKGVAVRKNTLSRNQRFYLDKTLDQGASSFIEEPITENHKDWREKRNHIGKVQWMAYDADGCMEYVAEVWNPAMVAELKLYAQNPAKSKVRSVSIEADYLYDCCPVCKQRFTDNNLFQKHMSEVEFKPMTAAPSQMKGRALSIVTSPATPGVPNATLTVMETLNGFSRLLETVTKTVQEEQEYMSKNNLIGLQPRPTFAIGSVAEIKLKESEAPAKPGVPASAKEITNCLTCGKPLNAEGECTNKECKPVKEELSKTEPIDEKPKEEDEPHLKEKAPQITLETSKETPKQITIKEAAKINKLVFKEFVKPTFTSDLVESGQATQIIKEKKELDETFKAVTTATNEIIEYLSQPFTIVEDDLSWRTQIASFADSVNEGFQKVTASINNVPVYDDKVLREAVANIPKDDMSWRTSLTEQGLAIKDITEKYLSLAAQNTSEVTGLKETVKQLTETVTSQKKDFDSLLAVADRNSGELRKQLEETKRELEATKKLSESTQTELKTAN